MIIGSMTVEIFMENTFSLKDKRHIVKSLIERLKNRYNISIVEVDRQDDIRWAVIGMACVSNSTEHLNRQLDNVLSFMENDGLFDIVNVERELL